MLLQKTLLNVEGLGRQLDPELDLWNTAKPFLERWMQEQVGWKAFVSNLKREAPRYAQIFPEFPRLVHLALQPKTDTHGPLLKELIHEQRRTNRMLQALIYGGVGFVLGMVLMYWAEPLLWVLITN